MKKESRLQQFIKEYKEADEFVKSEYETDEEKKDDKIVRITLIALGIIIVALFGVIVFAVKVPITTIYKTYSTLDNNQESTTNDNSNYEPNSDNPYINGSTTRQTYKAYKIGDLITLKDNSKWYVIENSSSDDINLVLIATNNINDGSVNYQNVEEFLDKRYKVSLAKVLNITQEELIVRLISLNDISNLSGINEEQLVVNSVIQNNKTPKFIYETINMTNYIDDENKPLLICPNNGKAILCIGNPPLNAWIIKPVIELPKSSIK